MFKLSHKHAQVDENAPAWDQYEQSREEAKAERRKPRDGGLNMSIRDVAKKSKLQEQIKAQMAELARLEAELKRLQGG